MQVYINMYIHVCTLQVLLYVCISVYGYVADVYNYHYTCTVDR